MMGDTTAGRADGCVYYIPRGWMRCMFAVPECRVRGKEDQGCSSVRGFKYPFQVSPNLGLSGLGARKDRLAASNRTCG